MTQNLDPTVVTVMTKLHQRSLHGMAKYGTTLADNPLTTRQWLVHAQEEAMDLALYLQCLIDAEPTP